MCNVLFTFFACIPLIIHVNNDIILISRLDWNIKLMLIDHTNTPTYPSVSISSFFMKWGIPRIYERFISCFTAIIYVYLWIPMFSKYFTRTFWQTLYIFFKVKSSNYSHQVLMMVFYHISIVDTFIKLKISYLSLNQCIRKTWKGIHFLS